jgi:Flp pilus assembly protein TadD
MLLLAIVAAGALIWLAFFYFGSKGISRRADAGKEDAIRFELAAAPRSDRHVESLLAANPKSMSLLRQYVGNAMDRQDWPEALRRADLFIARLPKSADGRLARINILRMSGHGEESVALLRKLVRRTPKDPGVLWTWSEEAIRRQDWAEAVLRLERLRKWAPDWTLGHVEAAKALVASGRRDEAEALLAEAMRRSPEEWRIWQAAAWIAEGADEQAGAIRRWEQMRAAFPAEPAGFLGGAEALARAGEAAAAAALIRQARDFFPGDAAIKEAAARLVPEAPQEAV